MDAIANDKIHKHKFTENNSFNSRISLDNVGYTQKPVNIENGVINNRIAKLPHNVNQDNIKSIADIISKHGHTFTPATFKDGIRRKENFEQMQLFTLDFDSGIPFKDIKNRADKYNLPILFAYNTFSSVPEHERFRAVFLNDISIDNPKVAGVMLKALMNIFPEADK